MLLHVWRAQDFSEGFFIRVFGVYLSSGLGRICVWLPYPGSFKPILWFLKCVRFFYQVSSFYIYLEIGISANCEIVSSVSSQKLDVNFACFGGCQFTFRNFVNVLKFLLYLLKSEICLVSLSNVAIILKKKKSEKWYLNNFVKKILWIK